MPWDTVKLNSGYEMPSIAFGTWKMGNGDGPIFQVDQAIHVGFDHIDTAQSYRNEAEAGKAIRDSGLKREEIFITTKYSGSNGLNIKTSINNSLKNLGVSYIDLYLIHHPSLAVPDIPTIWKQMEEIKKQGLVRSIGVSNFGVNDLATLLASAEIRPAVNQILFHPYVYQTQVPILEYAKSHDIVIEGYSCLIPITQRPGGPVDAPVNKIASRLGVTPDQVLMAWVKHKGVVVVTTSSKKERLEGYLNAGDLSLTEEEVIAIDLAGADGEKMFKARKAFRKGTLILLACAAALGLYNYIGVY